MGVWGMGPSNLSILRKKYTFKTQSFPVARGLRVNIFTRQTKAPNFFFVVRVGHNDQFQKGCPELSTPGDSHIAFFQNGRPKKWTFLCSFITSGM